MDLSDPVRRDKLMRLVSVNDVWGIGRQTTKRLQLMGIHTAYDLAMQSVAFIQSQFNIVVARTVMELNGIACLSLEDITPDKQQIVCSRSFKRRLTTYDELAEALVSFCNRVAEKLRKQNSATGSITIFIRTNPYNPNEPQYQRSIHALLNHVTTDTRDIIMVAKRLLKDIFKTGYCYQKCGVQLGQIQPAVIFNQTDLFDMAKDNNSDILMTTLDKINRRFPKGVMVSAAGINNSWKTPVEHLSQRYTTS